MCLYNKLINRTENVGAHDQLRSLDKAAAGRDQAES